MSMPELPKKPLLMVVAAIAVACVLGVWYWHQTGEQAEEARERMQHESSARAELDAANAAANKALAERAAAAKAAASASAGH